MSSLAINSAPPVEKGILPTVPAILNLLSVENKTSYENKYPIYKCKDSIKIDFLANFSYSEHLNTDAIREDAILKDIDKNFQVLVKTKQRHTKGSLKVTHVSVSILNCSEQKIETDIKLEVYGKTCAFTGFYQATYHKNSFFDFLMLPTEKMQDSYMKNPKQFSESQQKVSWFREFENSHPATALSNKRKVDDVSSTQTSTSKNLNSAGSYLPFNPIIVYNRSALSTVKHPIQAPECILHTYQSPSPIIPTALNPNPLLSPTSFSLPLSPMPKALPLTQESEQPKPKRTCISDIP